VSANRRTQALGIAAALIGGTFAASSASAITLQDAVALGVAKHPRVAGAVENESRAHGVVREAYAAFLPQVDVDAQAGLAHFTKPGNVSHAKRNTDIQQGTLSLSQLLFDGFTADNLHEAAKYNVEAARFDKDAAANEIAQRVIVAYLSVLESRQIVRLAEDNVALHNEVVQDVTTRASSGGGSQADVYQAEARLSLAKARLVRVQGDLRQAEANYLEAVGDPASQLDPATAPVSLVPQTLDAAIATAIANNPQKLSASQSVNAADRTIGAVKGAFYPRFDLQLISNWENGTGGRDEERADYRGVVRMRYNLYAGGADLARERQAVAESGQARQREMEIARLLTEQVAIDYNEMKVAENEVPLLEDRVDATDEVVTAYRRQFELGRRTLIDVLDAGNELFQARSELVRGEYRRTASYYKVLNTTGVLLKSLNVSVPTPSDS
jgi:adhesin transport system outer membrane protein